jgi:hypothetical protein
MNKRNNIKRGRGRNIGRSRRNRRRDMTGGGKGGGITREESV